MSEKKYTYLSKNTARILFIIPGFLLLLAGCSTRKQHHVHPAFYYWKTNLRIGPAERAVLQQTGAKDLYLRLFDVDWPERQAEPAPVGLLQSNTPIDNELRYIPVVYITQRCLHKMQPEQLDTVAANITQLIGQLTQKYGLPFDEIQIDCDWTKGDAERYFALLKRLKAQPLFTGKQLSCTIRMHQVKYTTSSGIPPVDKGLLMVYNMGNLTKYGSHNSILEVAEAKSYLKHLGTYPLPLDIALPVYYWSALFDHQRFKGIVYNVDQSQFPKGDLAQVSGNLYRFRSDASAMGYTFTKGQEIRFESPSVMELKQIAAYLSETMQQDSVRVAFFHLDSFSMQHFPTTALQEILQEF